MLVSLLLACSGTPEVPPDPAANEAPEPVAKAEPTKRTISFQGIEIEAKHRTAKAPDSTQKATVNGTELDISFHTLLRRGDNGFGDIFALDGTKVDLECNEQDFNSMFEASGQSWLVSHFECTPGGMHLTKLASDGKGLLSAGTTKPVDFSAVHGLWNPCAGQVSPWGTHLSSEEYEPNASRIPVSLKEDGWNYKTWKGMERALPKGQKLNPYHYGWTPEVSVLDAEGTTKVVKHKAPGRFSHEIAFVLPDERTTYLSDDGSWVGWYMFVADKAKDLSAGTLYAAKFDQRDERSGGIAWINLGHATNEQVDELIDAGVTFDDLFVSKPLAADTKECPEGFTPVAGQGMRECLKLKEASEKVPDPALAASRLETRRYAGYLGATLEFEKGEGVTFDPEKNRIYVAMSKIQRRMLEEEFGPTDDIHFEKNTCGSVMGGGLAPDQRDAKGTPINSKYVQIDMALDLVGTPIEEDELGNTCAPDGIANPDNITLLPGYGMLAIGEDTSKHELASLWMYDVRTEDLTRAMISPAYGEITGIHWIPNLAGHGYLTVAVQHPWVHEALESKPVEGITAADRRSFTGYLGPFPPLD